MQEMVDRLPTDYPRHQRTEVSKRWKPEDFPSLTNEPTVPSAGG